MRYPVLIGLMGCGKSSIGRRLAAALGCGLVDLDDAIVQRAGMSIPELFAAFGEAHFRDLETAMLEEALNQEAIIATGGGVVLRERNRALLKGHPPVIWLKASPEFLANRIDGDRNRPLIAGGDTLERLRQLAAERYPLYEACADHVIARDSMKKKQVVAAIRALLSPDGG